MFTDTARQIAIGTHQPDTARGMFWVGIWQALESSIAVRRGACVGRAEVGPCKEQDWGCAHEREAAYCCGDNLHLQTTRSFANRADAYNCVNKYQQKRDGWRRREERGKCRVRWIPETFLAAAVSRRHCATLVASECQCTARGKLRRSARRDQLRPQPTSSKQTQAADTFFQRLGSANNLESCQVRCIRDAAEGRPHGRSRHKLGNRCSSAAQQATMARTNCIYELGLLNFRTGMLSSSYHAAALLGVRIRPTRGQKYSWRGWEPFGPASVERGWR
jgi:hypothetical protein